MRKRNIAIAFVCIVLCVTFLNAGDALAQCEIESIGFLGRLDTEHLASEVVVSGSYAYLATGGYDQPDALQVVDISDPMAPRIVGSVSLPGSSESLALAGSYVYYMDSGNSLYIIDVSDPTTPFVAGSLDASPFYGHYVAVSGSYAYVGSSTDGLIVIDISNPTSPQIVGSLGYAPLCTSIPCYTGVAVSDSHAYLTSPFGVTVVDVDDPTTPQCVAAVDLGHYASDIAIVGSYAYVAGGDSNGGALDIVDISDPASPTVVAYVRTPPNSSFPPFKLEISGDFAYLSNFGLMVVNISDPTRPFLVNQMILSRDANAYDVAVSGAHAFVTMQTTGPWPDGGNSGYLQVLDVSKPTQLPVLESLGIAHRGKGVAVAGSHAYVATGDGAGNSLEVVDISSPQSLSTMVSIDLPLEPTDIVVSEPYAYVGVASGYPDYTGRLEIIDISDPAAPAIAGGIDLLNRPYGVAVSGTYAYVVDRDSLLIADVGDPASAGIIGQVDVPGAQCVTVRDAYAYAGSYAGELHVIDVSTPTDPHIVGSVSYGPYGGANDVTLSDSYAYIADYNDVWVIDISDPTTPDAVASVDVIGNTVDIVVEGNCALACSSDWPGVLSVLDISNPLAPYVSAMAQTEDNTYGVAVSNSIAYLAGGSSWNGGILRAIQLCPNSGGTPAIALSTNSVSASNNQGVNPPDQQFEVWNSGDGTLSYTINRDVDWIYPDPLTGGSVGEHDRIVISFDTFEFPPGQHTGTIIVADAAAINEPQQIDVIVTVYPTYHTLSTGASPPEAGTVTGGETYGYGETVEMEARPNAGWEFDHWECDNDSSVDGSKVNPKSIWMNADKSVTAVFTRLYHDLTIYSYPAGAGVAQGTGSYAYGSTIVLSAEPNYGWRFSHWEGDDINGSTHNPEQITMDADKTVTAVFEVIPLTHLYLAEPANGSVCYFAPWFSWTSGAGTDTGFSVDLSFSLYGPYYSTWNLYGKLVLNEYWQMPSNIWNTIPSGSYVFWRVRGVERGVPHPPIVYSNTVWWFYKP